MMDVRVGQAHLYRLMRKAEIAAEELAGELASRYPEESRKYSSNQRRYNNDMETVHEVLRSITAIIRDYQLPATDYKNEGDDG